MIRTATSAAALLLGSLLHVVPSAASARQANLDVWISDEVTPYVADKLATHPRFKGQSVRFVVMRDGKPEPTANALALALRDRLQDSLVDTPGIRIAWRPWQPDGQRSTGRTGIDCTADEIDYYIGLELTEGRSGNFQLSVRALDLDQRQWVAGFGKTWQGQLTTLQYRAYRRIESDRTFQGDRDVPYSAAQMDLLAAHLAHELGCTLLRQVSGEYVATLTDGSGGPTAPQGMIDLVTNNLAGYQALQITPKIDEANAVIEARAHRIDDELYQYWITVRPTQATPELPSLSASAYVELPQQYLLAEAVAEDPPPAIAGSAAVLTSLKLVEVEPGKACRETGFGSSRCFALQTQTSADAVVFFLNYQLSHGLVRLSGPACARHANARIARAEQRLRFALPAETIADGSWRPAEGWQADPRSDSYHAIAVSDTEAARALTRHVERLPRRCSGSVRSGLEGEPLRRWLEELGALAASHEPHVDWRTIHVRNMY